MKILLRCPGYCEPVAELQPWKYFDRIGKELAKKSHETWIDSCTGESAPWEPDLVIDALGPLTLLKQEQASSRHLRRIGVITYPIYTFGEIARAGPYIVSSQYRHTYQHIAALALRKLIARRLNRSQFETVVAESISNMTRLNELGVQERRIVCIPPGVDEEFISAGIGSQARCISDHPILTYMGSLMPLRGVDYLLRIYPMLLKHFPTLELRLLIRHDRRSTSDGGSVRRWAAKLHDGNVNIVAETLTKPRLIQNLLESNALVFPFRLVPSEMPVGPLEALATGCEVIVPNINGLGELAGFGARVFEQGNLSALTSKLRTALEDTERAKRRTLVHIPSWGEAARLFEEVAIRDGGFRD